MPDASTTTRLPRLLAELPPPVTVGPRASRLAEVPLIHGTNDHHAGAALRDGALWSRERRDGVRLRSEVRLQLAGSVYASAGVLYPRKVVAFLFGPEVDRAGGVATPWDSGHLAAGDRRSDDAVREIYQRYALPGPAWRQYFVACVAALYADPTDYLQLGPPALAHPSGVAGGGEASRIFEVRFEGSLSLSAWGPPVIFAPADPGEPLRSGLARAARGGAEVRFYDRGTPLLRGLVLEYIEERLGLRQEEP